MNSTVVIADVESRIHRELKPKLLARGYELLCASSAQEALARFDLRRVDFLLIDLDVPSPDGWSCLAQAIQMNPALRVIGLTERSDVGTLNIPAHCQGIAEKPIDTSNLFRVMEEMLAHDPEWFAFRFVPAKTAKLRDSANLLSIDPGVCPAAYSRWGINE